MGGIILPSLYPHQEDLRDRTRAALVKHRAVIMSIIMGGGKTRLAKWILGAAASKRKAPNASGRVVFAVHRRGLVDNASDSFNEEPALPHGLIMAGKESMWGLPIQVASIDTLLSWFVEGVNYTTDYTFDIVVIDETHSHLGKFRTFLNAHNLKREELGLHEPYVLGLTATPQADGLSDVFKEIVFGPDAQWMTDNGFIKPYRYFRATQGKLSKLVKRGDEFTEASVADAMDGLAGDLVRDWLKHAQGRATVGFFPRRSHAYEAMEMLRANGVNAEYVDGQTDDDSRRAMFKRLNEGKIDYICNVGVVERGTDIPRIGCVQVCTAIGSIARWQQIIGRASRKHPEVPDAVILDHGGNIKRHGFMTDKVHWSLDWSQRPAKTHKTRPTVECPQCDAIYRGGKCKNCGYEPKPKELKAQGLLFDGRELTEIKPKDTGKKAKSPEDYLVSALYRAGKSGKTFSSAVVMARQAAQKDGVEFRVPKRFTVAGRTYESIPYGDKGESSRKVRDTYPFTVGNWSERDNPYLAREFNEPQPTELF